MSTPIALPAPKVFRLPRVRFKRPRWPRGNRASLVLAATNLVWLCANVFTGEWGWAAYAATLLAWALSGWWRSRDDDDGPSAT